MSAKNRNHRWECIVHVGDMSSLALDLCYQSKCRDISVSNGSAIPFRWPSPKHRVISPMNKERVSLVFFGYPPRGLSLYTIQKLLDDWQLSSRGRRLPLEDYYLLRNQSTLASNGCSNGDVDPLTLQAAADKTYCSFWNLPIQDIVRLKWEQVNCSRR